MNYAFIEKLLIRYNMVLVEKPWLFNERVKELDLSRFEHIQRKANLRHPEVFLKSVFHSGSPGRAGSFGSPRRPEWGMMISSVSVCRPWLMTIIFRGSWEEMFHSVPEKHRRIKNDARLDLGWFDSCGLSMKRWWNYNIQFNSIRFSSLHAADLLRILVEVFL